MTSSKLEVLTPANCQIIFIDHQPQMAFGVQSIDRQVLKNNTVALAKAAKVFNIPTIITTVETESFSGNTYPELLDVFPGQDILERTSMNSWDDQKVRDALTRIGKQDGDRLLGITGAETTEHYRNKAQYPVGRDREGNIVTGFYRPRIHDIVPF